MASGASTQRPPRLPDAIRSARLVAMSQPYREGEARPDDQWEEWLGPGERTPTEQVRKALDADFQNAKAVLLLVEAQGKEIARLQTMMLCLLRALGRRDAVDLDVLGADARARMAAAQIAVPPRGRHRPI